MYLILLRRIKYFQRLVDSLGWWLRFPILFKVTQVVLNFDISHIVDCVIQLHVFNMFFLALLDLLGVFVDSRNEFGIALGEQVISGL